MKKVQQMMDKCLAAFCMLMLGIIVICYVYTIVMRYFFHFGSAKVDELIKYVFVWFIYLSMALATQKKRHVAVNVVVELLKGGYHAAVSILMNIGFIYFNCFIAYAGIQLILDMMALDAKTSALGIPQWSLYLILPIAFLWSSIYVVRDIVEQVRELAGKGGGEADV